MPMWTIGLGAAANAGGSIFSGLKRSLPTPA
jgi:hypothetical protein